LARIRERCHHGVDDLRHPGREAVHERSDEARVIAVIGVGGLRGEHRQQTGRDRDADADEGATPVRSSCLGGIEGDAARRLHLGPPHGGYRKGLSPPGWVPPYAATRPISRGTCARDRLRYIVDGSRYLAAP